jgi:hypothetical protein
MIEVKWLTINNPTGDFRLLIRISILLTPAPTIAIRLVVCFFTAVAEAAALISVEKPDVNEV